MKENILELYNTTVKPTLEDLESIRKKVKFWAVLLNVTVALIFIGFFIRIIPFIVIILVLAPLCIFFSFRMNKHKKGYTERFKKEVVEKVIHLINPDYVYEPSKHIAQREYKASRLFEHRVDSFKGDDLVTGVIDKTDFRFSEIHSQYKTETTDKDGKKQTHWHTIFKGLFLHADFNKEIKGSTFILPDKKSFLKIFGEKRKTSKGELVKLENVEFEELFKVYGTDQIEPRYILTPAIMEAIVKIKKRFPGNSMCFSFVGSRVNCTISFKKDLFEPRIFSSGVNSEDLYFMAELIDLIKLMIEELNLNTRIWTKK